MGAFDFIAYLWDAGIIGIISDIRYDHACQKLEHALDNRDWEAALAARRWYINGWGGYHTIGNSLLFATSTLRVEFVNYVLAKEKFYEYNLLEALDLVMGDVLCIEPDHKIKYWDVVKCLIENGAPVDPPITYVPGGYSLVSGSGAGGGPHGSGGGGIHYIQSSGRQYTPMRLAALDGNLEMVKFLLEKGATSEIPALFAIAEYRNHTEVAEYLKQYAQQHGQQMPEKTILWGKLYSHYDLELLTHILDNGGDVNHRDTTTRKSLLSLVIEAAGANHTFAITHKGANINDILFLLKKNPDVNVRDSSGRTPLHTLCNCYIPNSPTIAKILLEKGADINARDKSLQTPLLEACIDSHYSHDSALVRFLVENGADVNAQDEDGNSILHRLVSSSYFNAEIVCHLIEKGADLSVKNKAGVSAGSMLTAKLENGYFGEEDAVFVEQIKLLCQRQMSEKKLNPPSAKDVLAQHKTKQKAQPQTQHSKPPLKH